MLMGFFYQAWELHKDKKSLELVEKCIHGESMNLLQCMRSIHVGLLCVQQRPEDRPTMASVVLMLESEGQLPTPKLPGYFYEKTSTDTGSSRSTYEKDSTNELTITMLNARQ